MDPTSEQPPQPPPQPQQAPDPRSFVSKIEMALQLFGTNTLDAMLMVLATGAVVVAKRHAIPIDTIRIRVDAEIKRVAALMEKEG